MHTREQIEFNTILEDYNIYSIENGQILKVKQMPVEIINVTTNEGKQQVRVALKLVSHIITPPTIDTSGLEFANPDTLTDKDHIKELVFDRIKEVSNLYETKRSVVMVEPYVTKVFLTNKKTSEGGPILRYLSQVDITLTEKRSFLRTLSSEQRNLILGEREQEDYNDNTG
jgi:hypothetical protein